MLERRNKVNNFLCSSVCVGHFHPSHLHINYTKLLHEYEIGIILQYTRYLFESWVINSTGALDTKQPRHDQSLNRPVYYRKIMFLLREANDPGGKNCQKKHGKAHILIFHTFIMPFLDSVYMYHDLCGFTTLSCSIPAPRKAMQQ